ncbi:MAG: endosialidase [Lachnospiraceae bacterium]|nr:endosialidase [Lachnospiraceae bacterium]
MSVISELIRTEADGTISFGNYELSQKSKISDFEHKGDLYKVKTFKEITKLERNGMFVYESVPGSAVKNLSVTETGMVFEVEAPTDVQITVELEEDTHYQVSIDGKGIGEMKTNLGGKLVLSVELDSAEKEKAEVQIEKA